MFDSAISQLKNISLICDSDIGIFWTDTGSFDIKVTTAKILYEAAVASDMNLSDATKSPETFHAMARDLLCGYRLVEE